MADNVTFQTSVTATPPNATTVATDDVGGAQYQRIKLDIGGDGASSPVTLANPMPIGTLPGGTVIVSGTVQALGSVQGVGTFQVLGSVQGVGTFQMLGTLQPLAGSVHIASGIPGTVQVLGSVQSVGTQQGLGTYQPLAGSVHLASTGTLPLGTVQVLGSIQPVGTSQVLGTTQPLAGSVHLASPLPGTVQVLGSVQAVGTAQTLGTVQTHGTSQVLGSVAAQGVVAHDAVAAGNPILFGAFGSSGTQIAVADGDMVRLWADLNGRLQIRGTIDSMPSINVATGTIPGGTIQAFGTTEILGTVRALTTVTVTVGTIVEGTINNFTGTIGGGTIQTLLGTMVTIGSVAHGAAADTRPILFAGFGSSGTQAAVDDGDSVRAWFDLNGRQVIRGTIDSMPAVAVSAVAGTVQVLGSVQAVGTNQVLGTTQPLAGSVHLANIGAILGSVSAQGYVAAGVLAAGNPVQIGAVGSSGTLAAQGDGSIVRLWADLNGRQIVRGTIDQMPAVVVTSVGGTVQVLGSVQPVGTVQALGSVSVQGLTPYLSGGGSANPVLGGGVALAARPGTSTIGSVVRDWYDQHGRQVVQVGNGTTAVLGTFYVANGNGTLLPAVGAGSFVRIYDILVSGSAAGTVRILNDTTAIWGPLFLAANGGWNMNSAVGVKFAANTSLTVVNGMGSLSVTINYGVEGA